MTAPTRVVPELVARLETALMRPVYFRQLLDAAEGHRYRDILAAWSEVRKLHSLQRDERGRYWLASAGADPPVHND